MTERIKTKEKTIYEKAEGGGGEPPGTTVTWLLNNTHFWYNGESPTNNDHEKKQHFLKHKEKQENTKEVTQTAQRTWERGKDLN